MSDTAPIPTSTPEPARLAGIITAIVAAVLGLFVSFGLSLDAAQTGAVTTLVGLLAPLAAAEYIRRRVTPSSVVAVKVGDAGTYEAGDAFPVDNGTLVEVREALGPVDLDDADDDDLAEYDEVEGPVDEA